MELQEAKQFLSYPFDSALLVRKRGPIQKALEAQDKEFLEKRIAILGGSTTQQVASFLELFLLSEGIRPVFYQSSYARFWEDAVFGNPELDEFNPDLVFVHTTIRNAKIFELRDVEGFDQGKLIEEDIARFNQFWEALTTKFSCPIIQNNFERPPYRLLGNQDICDARGLGYYARALNSALYDFVSGHDTFFIHDIEGLAADLGMLNWHDSEDWCMYKNAFAAAFLPDYAYSVSRIIKALYGKNKKAVILDLDNTLWHGVVGDDGVDGILMGTENATGEQHRELQIYLRNLTTLGTILAVNSKNEMENAVAGLEHPDSVLPPEKFASIKANWNPKSVNMEELADDLNLGIDSFLFVDDNPAEREIISQQIPEVECVPFDNVGQVAARIDRGGYFEVTSYTEDDAKRAEMYRQNAQRKSAERSFADYDSYLASLEMVADDVDFADEYMARIAQLTNKTNQFNLTTRRFTEDDMKGFREDGSHVCLATKLADKFGDNGLVSIVVGEEQGNTLEVILWLMSCRVMKRGLEDHMLNRLVAAAADRGLEKVVGRYLPTAKNKMVKDLYKDYGFTLVEEDAEGNAIWELKVSDFAPRITQISIEGA